MSTDLIKKVISLYLYGTDVPPSNLVGAALIRNDGITPSLNGISASDYMLSGGGRFAKASQFDVINKFFDTSNVLSVGSYSLTSIIAQLHLNSDSANVSIDQKKYVTPFLNIDDYFERVFVFNNAPFSIQDNPDLQFVVKADGSRYIENLKIVPRTDNFDFVGGDDKTTLLNTAVRPFIDPYANIPGNDGVGLGRKVLLNFDDTAPTIAHYTQADVTADKAFLSLNQALPDQYLTLGPPFASLLNDLWNSGITRFLDDHGRPILYGTNGNDTISASDINSIYQTGSVLTGVGTAVLPDLTDYQQNGVALIGGAGADRLTGGSHNDVLYGGLDGDTLNGGAGQDTADYSLATGILGVSVTMLGTSGTAQAWNGNAVVGTGTDSLSSIEIVQGTASSDRFSGGNSEVTFIGGSGSDLYNVTWGGAMPKIVELAGDSGTDAISVPSGVTPGNYERMDSGDGGYILTPKDGVSGAAYTIPANIENVAYATGS